MNKMKKKMIAVLTLASVMVLTMGACREENTATSESGVNQSIVSSSDICEEASEDTSDESGSDICEETSEKAGNESNGDSCNDSNEEECSDLNEEECNDSNEEECSEYDDYTLGKLRLREINVEIKKPVIYLYPENTTKVEVKLDCDGELTCTYPFSDGEWSVIATPEGILTDEKGIEYNYLYWEGNADVEYDMTKGFCVAGKDTAVFLEDALESLGLTRKEANEFIVYWLPLMQNNPYNVISFQEQNYTDAAKLEITPTPDTVIRICMAWKPSENYISLPVQELHSPERTGFTVVEWGGMELK